MSIDVIGWEQLIFEPFNVTERKGSFGPLVFCELVKTSGSESLRSEVIVEILSPSLLRTESTADFEDICRRACFDAERDSNITSSTTALKCVAVGLLPSSLQVCLSIAAGERGIGIVRESNFNA